MDQIVTCITMLLIASFMMLNSSVAMEESERHIEPENQNELQDSSSVFNDYRTERSYDGSDCPLPNFSGNRFEVIDYWPDGANIKVTVKPHGPVENGWTIMIVFTRSLPVGARLLVWNAQETARVQERYITLANRAHNPNLSGVREFSFTFVIEGASMKDMLGYTAMVSFYPGKIEDAACYLRVPNYRPTSTPLPTQPTTTTKWAPLATTKQTTRWTPPTTRQTTRWTPRPTTRSTRRQTTKRTIRPIRPTRTQRPYIIRTTVAPRRTTRRAPRFERFTTKAPYRKQATKRQRTTRRPSTTRPRKTTRRQPTHRPKKTTRRPPTRRPKKTTRRPPTRRPKKTTRQPPTHRPRKTTRRPPATRAPRTTRRPDTKASRLTTPPVYMDMDMPEYRMSHSMVNKHKGKCRVLPNGYNVQNRGYDAGNDLADGEGRKYRFNAGITIPVKDGVSQWTLKLVFAEPIESIQLWEATAGEHSSDGRVWLIKPQTWNTELHEQFEFLMIPLMRVSYAPPAVAYLCENGNEPTLLGNGIFDRKDGGGEVLSQKEIEEQEEQEKERQNRIRQEQAQRAKEQRERERAEQIRREKEEEKREQEKHREKDNRRESQHETGSPSVGRVNPPTTTTRPRATGPRCSGNGGYVPQYAVQTKPRYKQSPPNERKPYDYNEVLCMSVLFYEAQRSGKLPSNNRIPWRGDSALKDGCDVGEDLTGGWYDAGDHVKFGFPMAWSATTLAWGTLEFADAYKDSGEYKNMLSSMRWVADYFVKAHTSKYELYGQIGGGGPDHSYWGRAEEMKMKRPAFKITQRNPGTELAAETAAALAAISIIFRKEDPSYSRKLVKHAEELYEFADKYRQNYHKSISDAQGYYRSYNGYNDELVWGALWLYKATNKKPYLDDGVRKYAKYGGDGTPKMFSWDDKRAGSQVLIAQLTGDKKYRDHIMAYQNFLMRHAMKTPQGMVWLDQWGSNRYAANAAFITLAAANIQPTMREKSNLIKFAKKQIHLLLGDAGRSYVVGYGRNPPVRPHHRSSSCPPPPRPCDWNSAYNNPSGNYFKLYGALVGGPNSKGGYVDKRSDYVSNEVATDFNAGFQSAVAGLKHFQIEARRG